MWYQWFEPSPPPSVSFSTLPGPSSSSMPVSSACSCSGGEQPHHAHRVFALDLVARMHHLVGELAGIREEQQPLGVEIEATDRDPLAVADVGQLFEHRRPPLGVVARDDLAGGLVIHEDPCARLREANLHELAVDPHFVARGDFLTDVGRLAVHRDSPGEDHLLHRTARAESARGQHLVQALRLGEDLVSGRAVARWRQALRDLLQRQARLLHRARRRTVPGPGSRARVALRRLG